MISKDALPSLMGRTLHSKKDTDINNGNGVSHLAGSNTVMNTMSPCGSRDALLQSEHCCSRGENINSMPRVISPRQSVDEGDIDHSQDILHIHSCPKKRVSKACYRCRQSKTRCININGGVCERCINENELCIYSKPPKTTDSSNSNDGTTTSTPYSSSATFEPSVNEKRKTKKETYQQGKIKRMYNQEYINLLENKVAIYEIFTKQVFNNFNKLIDANVLEMKDFHGNKSSTTDDNNYNNNNNSDDQECKNQKSVEKSVELWSKLFKNKEYFCTPEFIPTTNNVLTENPTNVNINQLIYLILPHNIDVAVKSINYIADEERDPNLIFKTKTTSNMDLSHLTDSYVNKNNFFQSDLHQPVIEKITKIDSEKPPRKRRRTSTAAEKPNSSSTNNMDNAKNTHAMKTQTPSITLPFVSNNQERSITPMNNVDHTTHVSQLFQHGALPINLENYHQLLKPLNNDTSPSSQNVPPPIQPNHTAFSMKNRQYSLPLFQTGMPLQPRIGFSPPNSISNTIIPPIMESKYEMNMPFPLASVGSGSLLNLTFSGSSTSSPSSSYPSSSNLSSKPNIQLNHTNSTMISSSKLLSPPHSNAHIMNTYPQVHTRSNDRP